MNKKIILSLLLSAWCCWGVHAQQVAVGTNLLYWATTTPNLSVEVAISQHSTLNVSANYNPWTIGDNKIQHWFVQPEYRYWLCEKFTRSYFGVHLIGGKFEVGGFPLPFNLSRRFQDCYYKGSAVGAGVSFGYHFYISPHWNLEAKLGVGLARVKYHTEPLSGPAVPDPDHVRILPVPTEIGLSFVYLFNSRK